MELRPTYVSEGKGYTLLGLRSQLESPINRRNIELQVFTSIDQRSTIEPIFSHAENENKRVKQWMRNTQRRTENGNPVETESWNWIYF